MFFQGVQPHTLYQWEPGLTRLVRTVAGPYISSLSYSRAVVDARGPIPPRPQRPRRRLLGYQLSFHRSLGRHSKWFAYLTAKLTAPSSPTAFANKRPHARRPRIRAPRPGSLSAGCCTPQSVTGRMPSVGLAEFRRVHAV